MAGAGQQRAERLLRHRHHEGRVGPQIAAHHLARHVQRDAGHAGGQVALQRLKLGLQLLHHRADLGAGLGGKAVLEVLQRAQAVAVAIVVTALAGLANRFSLGGLARGDFGTAAGLEGGALLGRIAGAVLHRRGRWRRLTAGAVCHLAGHLAGVPGGKAVEFLTWDEAAVGAARTGARAVGNALGRPLGGALGQRLRPVRGTRHRRLHPARSCPRRPGGGRSSAFPSARSRHRTPAPGRATPGLRAASRRHGWTCS